MSKKKKKKKQKDDDFIVGEDDFLPAEYFEGEENPFWEPPDDEPESEPDPEPEPESKLDYNKIRDTLYHSPKTVFDLLSERVYGNDEYKRTLSTLVWKAYNWQPPGGALLVVGPSGTGKTEAIRALRSYGNITCVNAASLTPTGYRGPSLTSALRSLKFTRTDTNGRKNGRPICVWDEADKLFQKAQTAWNDSGLIFELLKLIDGGCFIDIGDDRKHIMIDPSDITHIFLGSFSALTDTKKSQPIGFNAVHEDEPKYLTEEQVMSTLPPELQGRISKIVMLNGFTEQDYRNIMLSNRYSPVRRISDDTFIDIKISKQLAEKIANDAYQSKKGVRAMWSAVQAYVDGVLFDKPDTKYIYME